MVITRMNRLNASDPMVLNWMEAVQYELNKQRNETVQLGNDILFDKCSEKVLSYYEKEAGLNSTAKSIQDRRSAVMAKWLSDGVPSLAIIQQIADAWNYGKTVCTYSDMTIHVAFVDKGIPTGLDDLKTAIEEVKPAHLAVEYIFTYNTWDDVKTMTWNEVSGTTWEGLLVR